MYLNELEKELGYSQQYYKHVAILLGQTDEGITGWGECFGLEI